MRQELVKHIKDSFSSVESLRASFLATAEAMFGPGFVWLVKKSNNELAILTTYIAGTPYPGANFRRQSVDMNNVTTRILPTARPFTIHQHSEAVQTIVRDHAQYAGYAGNFGEVSEQAFQWVGGGADIMPLLAVSTWEHTFMPDWGAAGKRDFIERWWDEIDWDVVYHRGERW